MEHQLDRIIKDMQKNKLGVVGMYMRIEDTEVGVEDDRNSRLLKLTYMGIKQPVCNIPRLGHTGRQIKKL